jgi:hypothetical protein
MVAIPNVNFRYFQVEGNLTEEVMKKSLHDLQLRHPLLRSHLVEDEYGNMCYQTMPLPIKPIVIQHLSWPHFTSTTSPEFISLANKLLTEAQIPMPPDAPLLKIVYIRSNETTNRIFGNQIVLEILWQR